MYGTKKWITALASAAVLAASLTACSNDQPDAIPTAPPVLTSTPSVPGIPATSAPTPDASPATASPFDRLNIPLEFKPGQTPKSVERGGLIDGLGYAQGVMNSYKEVWAPALGGAKLDMPRFTYDMTSKGDVYRSTCTSANGEPIVVSSQTGAMLYCTQDSPLDGEIAISGNAIAALWNEHDDNRAHGDLAVTVAITSHASLILMSSLQRQMELPAVSDAAFRRTAICLSGAYAHVVYPNAFTAKDTDAVLEDVLAIPTIGDRGTTSLATDLDARAAWVLGFTSGNVAECGRTYWK